MEVETQAGMEVETQAGMEVETQAGMEVETQAGMEVETQAGVEVETQAGVEVETQAGVEVETQAGVEVETQAGLEVEMQAGLEVETQAGMEVETQAGVEVETQAGVEVETQAGVEVETQAGLEVEMQAGLEVVPESSPLFSPVAITKKMRRLRKVRETKIKENDEVDGVGAVSEKGSDGDVRLERRETAEEILKRFGKGEDAGREGGKRRKVVQSTIMAAVVDMAKQVEAEPVQGEEVARVDNVEAEDGDLDLESQGEEIAGSEEIASLNKRKRSNTVKRCSTHAIGLTFESAALGADSVGMDDVRNAPEIDGDINKDNQDGLDSENGNVGNKDKEDGGGPSDSEKGKEGNDDVDDSAEGLNSAWPGCWSGEGMSMDSILEKARQMVAEMSSPGVGSAKPTKEKKKPSEEALTVMDEQKGKKKKSKKEEERIKREELYAESQRLLRESKVAFVAPAPIMKPVSSVLEKIRQRRLQLGCSGSGSASSSDVETKLVSRRAKTEKSSTHVDLTVDGDTEVEIEMFSSNVVKIEEIKPEEVVVDMEVQQISTHRISRDKEDVQIAEADGKAQDDAACDEKSPATPEGQKELIRDDLDLLCASQLSPPTQESVEATPFEPVVGTATDFMGLDTQLLDEELMPRPMHDDHHLQNKETGSSPPGQSEVYTTATHVRGLIDDEAEDEDEDILAENVEEEEQEVLEDEDDLQDLIASTEKEKASDKARRDALHRKWLEQQDTEQTEDILERLRTGRSARWKGRERVVSCLDEDDFVNTRDSESLDKISSDSQTGQDGPFADGDHIEEPSISLRQRTRSQELEMDCLLDEYEDNEDIAREEPAIEDEIIEDEDEEEHEQSIIRKRLLEESEEQLSFMSPAEDESSREVLSLINKVNVGCLKTKSTAGHSDIRGLGSATSSKPSFLGRSSSSSSLPPPAHRQIGSGGSSRSFVFGRDDSNSGHGFPSNEAQEENPDVAKSAPHKGVSSTSTVGGKKRSAPRPTNGPSLFEMLKKQSKEHDQLDLKTSSSAISKKWSSNTEAFSIFATKKSVAFSRRKL